MAFFFLLGCCRTSVFNLIKMLKFTILLLIFVCFCFFSFSMLLTYSVVFKKIIPCCLPFWLTAAAAAVAATKSFSVLSDSV